MGKCKNCELIVRGLLRPETETLERVKLYGVTSVPTIVIDSRIKLTGKPEFPWFCSDDFYHMLESKYPLTLQLEKDRSVDEK